MRPKRTKEHSLTKGHHEEDSAGMWWRCGGGGVVVVWWWRWRAAWRRFEESNYDSNKSLVITSFLNV